MASTSWPHDPDGDKGSEGMRKYGMAILSKKVDEDEDFPLDRNSFLEAHGEDPVRINHETVVSVADIFEYVDTEEFESKVDFHKAVGEAFRQGGFWEFTPES
ncbi:MAG: DUF5785 family protein [Halobacteriaceae archaeon]